MSDRLPKLVVVVGETASGKSALALDLAQRFDGEIINADSWTVRREVDIGTAKPTPAEQALVPHHLFDIAGPDEDFTAAVFKSRAQAVIAEIAARGKLPILVGGTGLYIDAVLFDFGFLPAGDRGEREKLNELNVEQLLKIVNNRGINLHNIDTQNKRRLIRLIETNGQRPARQPLRANTLIIGLRTDRETLKDRITRRVDAQLAARLEDEVKTLVQRYGWDCEALKGVGYAQWRGYLEGQVSQEMVRQKIVAATVDLAKRQRTWFKRNPDITWFDAPVDESRLSAAVNNFLSSKV